MAKELSFLIKKAMFKLLKIVIAIDYLFLQIRKNLKILQKPILSIKR